MHRVTLAALALVYAASAFAQQAPQQASPQTPAFELEPGIRVLAPITHEQLSVYPVVKDAAPANPKQYMSLAAGLERKEVKVQEMADGGDVNHVRVTNKSTRPLLLLGGEIILGGQQDRVMSEDAVIPPKETQVVEVFCVEHGRWSGRTEFGRSGGMVEGNVRRIAKYAKDQGEVWNEVAKKTGELHGESETGTYRTLAEGDAGKKATEAFRNAIPPALKALPEAPKLVGIIGAVNGRIVSVDVFANPSLFASYRDRLLESLFITAAGQAVKADAKAPDEKAIKGFIADAEGAKEEQSLDIAGNKTLKKQGKQAVRSSVFAAPAAKDAPADNVYRSYQAAE
jgi:hypothetical protein